MGTTKVLLLAASLTATALFSGAVFGWTDLLILLKRSGVYADHCPAGVSDCPERDVALNLIMTVGSAVNGAGAVAVGFFLDTYGPQKTTLLSGIATGAGIYLFGTGLSYVAGYALLAFGGVGVLIASFRCVYLYPKWQSLIAGSLSSLFDLSAAVFVVFETINAADPAITMKREFVVLGIICAVVHVLVFGLWMCNKEHESVHSSGDDSSDGGDSGSVSASETDDVEGASSFKETDHLLGDSATSGLDNIVGTGDAVNDSGAEDNDSIMTDPSVVLRTPKGTKARTLLRRLQTMRYVLIAHRPFTAQLRTREFRFAVIFLVVNMWRSTFFLGTIQDVLERMGDADHGHFYSKAVAWIVPGGVVMVPFVGYILQHSSFATIAYIIVFMGTLVGGMTCIESLPVQLATTCVFTTWRALFFSFNAAFVAQVFGPGSVGRITGLMASTASVFIMTQNLVVKLVATTLHGRYLPVHITLTVVEFSLLLAVAWVHRHSKEMGVHETQKLGGHEDAHMVVPVTPATKPMMRRQVRMPYGRQRSRSAGNVLAASRASRGARAQNIGATDNVRRYGSDAPKPSADVLSRSAGRGGARVNFAADGSGVPVEAAAAALDMPRDAPSLRYTQSMRT